MSENVEVEIPRVMQNEEERKINTLIFTRLDEDDNSWGDNIVYRARKDGIEVFVGREKQSYKWIVHVTTQLNYKKPCDTSLEEAFNLAEIMFNELDDTLNKLV